MKFFVAFAALVVLAAATPLHKPAMTSDSELQAILAAIHHPSTDPATAELLMDMLYDLLGSQKPDISPALVEQPIQIPDISPALVEQPIQTPDISPALVEQPIQTPDVSPVQIDAGKPRAPLVQLIVNVAQANSPVVVPGAAPAPIQRPTPVQVPSPIPRPDPSQLPAFEPRF